MIDDATVDDLVRDAARVSDRGEVGLRAFARAFIEAHQLNHGELSVEVGTRNGGSAILFLGLLIHLYPEQHRPCLFTVDPYGSKPYNGGDVQGVSIYSDVNYVAQKQLLAPFPNHSHFQMCSVDFFDRLHGLPYWRPGNRTAAANRSDDGSPVSVPIGEKRTAGNLAFALLDGEHDSETIGLELFKLWQRWMSANGVVVVDNVDCDPGTLPMLMKWFQADLSDNGEWAVVRGFKNNS